MGCSFQIFFGGGRMPFYIRWVLPKDGLRFKQKQILKEIQARGKENSRFYWISGLFLQRHAPVKVFFFTKALRWLIKYEETDDKRNTWFPHNTTNATLRGPLQDPCSRIKTIQASTGGSFWGNSELLKRQPRFIKKHLDVDISNMLALYPLDGIA